MHQRLQLALLVALVAVYLVLTTIWSTTVPLGEGPDEPAHFDYALFVARTGRLPGVAKQGDEACNSIPRSALCALRSDVPGEGHQPPLGYWLMQPVVRWLPSEQRTLAVSGNPQFRWAGGDEAGGYLHGARELPPYGGQVLAWHLARGVSVVLGAITVLLCWATARRVFGQQPSIALGAAALTAFNPQFIFQHALVSNDPLLTALSSGLIYGSVCVVTTQPEANNRGAVWGMPIVLGIVLGLMLITKQSALALAPLPFVAYWLRSKDWQRFLQSSLITAGLVLIIAGWWYVHNLRLYGDLVGLQAFQQAFATGDFDPAKLADWRIGGWNLLRSSWALFGWQTVGLADGAYRMLLIALGLGVVGLCVGVGQGLWHGRGRATVVLIVASGLVVAWTVLFARTAGMVGWQGRFLFPAVGAINTLLAAGLAAVLPRRVGLVVLASGLLILSMLLPSSMIAPSYPVYAQHEPQILPHPIYAALDVGWQPGVELRSAEFAPQVTTGVTLPITLTWHVVEQLDRPWTMFVHVVAPDETIVAKLDAQPLDGRHPISKWLPEDWITDPQGIKLMDVPPGQYAVRVGLWDPQTDERLNVYDAQRQLTGDYVVIGNLTVTLEQHVMPNT